MERWYRFIFLVGVCMVRISCGAQGDIFFDSLELPEFSAEPPVITRQSTPCEILGTIYSQTHLNRILKNDLYAYTYPISFRNIITYPSLYTFTPKKSQVNWSVFYQQMPTVFPFANGIGGYLNLVTADYLRDVDIDIARVYNISVPKTISLLQNARVEQYRAGFMFDLWKRVKWVSIGVQFPFYAVARNYNLPLEDQQEIQVAVPTIMQQFGKSTSDNPTASKRSVYPYVLETRIGLGDMRLSLGAHILEKKYADLVLGVKCVLPSEATFASGFLGSDFSKHLERKYLDIETFMEEVTEDTTKEQAIETLTQFGMAGLWQLDQTLLGTYLGDFKRTQLGLYVQPTLRANDQVSLSAQLCANWLLAKKVHRFIKPVVDQNDFDDKYFDPDDFPPAECDAMSVVAMKFLSDRLQDVLMPPQYTVKLKPQFEVQVTALADIQFTDIWHFTIGYDYWRRHVECTNYVVNNCRTSVSCTSLQVPTALVPQLSQQKILLKAEYTKFKVRHNFLFAFGLDVPVSSKNIGDDYTGFMRFEWAF